ncbi:MAG: hypothetical protein O2904_00105 [bacterium]|nr:hypothetical protein [bacterium]
MSSSTYYLGIVYDQDKMQASRLRLGEDLCAVILEINNQIIQQLDRIRTILEVDTLTEHCISYSSQDDGLVIQLLSTVSQKHIDNLVAEANRNSVLTVSTDPNVAIPKTQRDIQSVSLGLLDYT